MDWQTRDITNRPQTSLRWSTTLVDMKDKHINPALLLLLNCLLRTPVFHVIIAECQPIFPHTLLVLSCTTDVIRPLS